MVIHLLYRAPRWRKQHLILLALVAVGLLFLLPPARVWGNGQSYLKTAYAQLLQLNHYRFVSRVDQITHPLPTLANVGLSSESSSVLVEGMVDQRTDQVELHISEQNGHMLDGLRQVELRIAEGQVWGRVQGQDWQALDPDQALDRATNNPSAFLHAARNVQAAGTEVRLGQVYQVLSFELDSVVWAEAMRQALQSEMVRRGELTPASVLARLSYYEKMTGAGTLWINEAGLPQRLALHMVYPPLPHESEYREVKTTTDFSDWQGGGIVTRLASSWWRALPRSSVEATSALSVALVVALWLFFPLALLRYRNRRGFYQTTVLFLVALFVSEPLLSAAVVQAADARRASRMAAVVQTGAEDERTQTAVEKIKADFALRSATNQSATATSGNVAGPSVALARDEATLSAQVVENPIQDTDGDGLDNYTEAALGLDPKDPDSDGDLLSDGFEVTGIGLNGKTWYLDPLNPDTNGDEIQDSQECIEAIDVDISPSGEGTKTAPKGNGICADTDGDSTPDFADNDNDDDGVQDWMDRQPDSRFGDRQNGVPNSTFAFAVDHYSQDKPLRIALELRPTTPQHLWYSMNVLDWPSGDYEGQIRRVHDTELGTTGAAANGNMQLVPMVEITLPAAEASHLPTLPGKAPIAGDNQRLAEWLDMAVLERYQMAVAWTQDKQSLQVYLPATLMRDKHGNAPVNFVATMLYQPNGSGLFSTDHAARLVWLVQMDVDHCVVPEGSTYAASCSPTGADYQDGNNWKTAKRQIVHRYHDSFYVTAFTVEQDLAVNGQIFYESPAQVTNPAAYVPDQLLGLGTVMEGYLRQNQTPAQALTSYQNLKTGIGSRLVSSTVITDTDAYGLIAKIGTAETPRILSGVFESQQATIPHPTLLYVTWGEANVTGLQGIVTDARLRLDMTQGTHKHATTIRLGAFTYNPNPISMGKDGAGNELVNPKWNPTNPGELWLNYLQKQSAGAYQQLSQTPAQPFSSAEFQRMLLGIFWNLARGVTLNVDLAQSFTTGGPTGATDAQALVNNLGGAFDKSGQNTIGAFISVFQDFRGAASSLKTNVVQILSLNMAGKAPTNLANYDGALRSAKWVRNLGAASATLAGASATLAMLGILKDQLGISEGAITVLDATNATVGAVLAGAQAAVEIIKVVKDVQAATTTAMQGLKSALAFKSTLGAVGTVAAVVVVALILVTSLVLFSKLLLDGNAVAAKSALAQGVATAIIVGLLFALSIWFPIGTAIALLLGLVDGIITAVCKIANWVDGKDAQGQTFEDRHNAICAGIVGNVTTFFTTLFYNTVPMVDMAYKDRLRFGQPDVKVVEATNNSGLLAGNQLKITQPLTVSVRLPDAHRIGRDSSGTEAMQIDGALGPFMPFGEYTRLIKEKNIFNYELVTDTLAAEGAQLKITTPQAWMPAATDDKSVRLYKIATPSLTVALPPGINRHPELYLREYTSYSLAECGLFAGFCDSKYAQFDKAIANTQHISIGQSLVLDIFPSTLTEFYTLEQVVNASGQTTNRYRLNWGGALPFPALKDADGDGLRVDIDPDDKIADADSDGLPDAFELQDARLGAQQADKDSDGLADYDEIRWGTRPDRADSDGDGLSDNDELTGWELVYADATGTREKTWVTADPMVFDTDGDGYADRAERVLALHPRARNTDVNVLSLHTETDQTHGIYLAPKQTLAFTSTVRNESQAQVAYGLLEAELMGAPQRIHAIPFELQPQQSQTIHGKIQAPASAQDEIQLRNRAGANMIDPAASYAADLLGLGKEDGLKFHLNFGQPPTDGRNFSDLTGNATITCPEGYCPALQYGSNGNAAFGANSWYVAEGNTLAFSQARFSLGGWITLGRAFGSKYNERVIVGPDNVSGADNGYLQLSLVDLQSDLPKVKIRFKATDNTNCEQTLTDLTVPFDQLTHLFVTYDGAQVHGYRNGVRVGSYTLQNCKDKIPAGNRFTIGRGITDATLYVHHAQFKKSGDNASNGEPYLLLNDSRDPFWQAMGVKDGEIKPVDKEFILRGATTADSNSTVWLCEEDAGAKDGKCHSSGGVFADGDDMLNKVTIDPRRNGSFAFTQNVSQVSPADAFLEYNVQNNFFQGQLYDLRIYENTLAESDVKQWVNGVRLTYHLDEASGRTQFRNAGFDAVPLVCVDANRCPTSGLQGYMGEAVRFTGGATMLTIGRLSERLGNNPVAAFWFKPEAVSSGAVSHPLLRYGEGAQGFTLYATQGQTNTQLSIAFHNSPTPSSPTSIPVDRWTHVTVVQQANNLELYVNGEKKQTLAGAGAPLTSSSPHGLQLGNGIVGLVDELHLYANKNPNTDPLRAYQERALLYLPLDETNGSTTFVNRTDAGNLVCDGVGGCPRAGEDGRVRESIHFTNTAGGLVYHAPASAEPLFASDFSVGLWVRLAQAPTEAALVTLYDDNTQGTEFAWRLQLATSNSNIIPQLWVWDRGSGGCQGDKTQRLVQPSGVNLALNQWHHLGVSFSQNDGKEVTLYLDGQPIHRGPLFQEGSSPCLRGSTLRVGQGFAGQMDELFVYNRALLATDFLSSYDYQNTWYDVVSTEHFQIDHTPPTLQLTSPGYVEAGTTIFGVIVSDAESGIRSVEYQAEDKSWKSAQTETATSGVWTFALRLDRSERVAVRATDNVGNVTNYGKQISVDSVPPVVSMTPTGGKHQTLQATGAVHDGPQNAPGSGVNSIQIMILRPDGQPLSPPRIIPLAADGAWSISQELPPNVTGEFKIWASAVDQVDNQSERIVGSVQVDNAGPWPVLADNTPKAAPDGSAPATLAGIAQHLPTLRGSVSDTLDPSASAHASHVQTVEVGLLHRQDKDDPNKVTWLPVILDSTNNVASNWHLQLPEGLEGVYDISLRATDALGNVRIEPGVWTGVIDTRAPTITLSVSLPDQMICTFTDFSLDANTVRCGSTPNSSSILSAQYAAGVFTQTGLTWNAAWYNELYQGQTPADRLYTLYQTGQVTPTNVSEATSCDIYGNCTRCQVTGVDTSTLVCTHSGGGQSQSRAPRTRGLAAPIPQSTQGSAVLSATVTYERPDAYAPGSEPSTPTATLAPITETYTLVADAVLAATRPFAAEYSEARTQITWAAYSGATHYFTGWSASAAANAAELTRYDTPGTHPQRLPDQGRYYAHVIAMNGEVAIATYTLGPIYFDGATPATYLNWDEYGLGQPYSHWQAATTPTGVTCNLLGVDDRAALLSNGASARSGEQRLYGTWNAQWLALHWAGVDLGTMGDLHLYIDAHAGGSSYAYDPYDSVATAISLVVMPERRHDPAAPAERMLADFALLVEDATTLRLLRWSESGWQEITTEGTRFTMIDGTVYLWLPLALLGVDPAIIDLSLVGFVSEEDNMAIWATMPGDNPLNSPEMLPSHLPAPLVVEHTLVNLQNSIRLTADPAGNQSLDNCPSQLAFDRALLDVLFTADPHGEVYDPVQHEGVAALVPDDIEPMLASLCAGVGDGASGTVCALAQQVANNGGGGGSEPGPTGQLHAIAGPGDPLVFHATVRNLASQPTGQLSLVVQSDLPIDGSVVDVGVLAPFESRTVSLTTAVDPAINADVVFTTLSPVETVVTDRAETLTYEHARQTVMHALDHLAPTTATLDARVLGDLLGVGEHLLHGVVYDQSPVTAIILETSLGQSFRCQDIVQRDAFSSAWSCPLAVPAETPDGTVIDVRLSASDAYGHTSGVIGQWSFTVDNLPPSLLLLNADGAASAVGTTSLLITDTLRLVGVAGDERLFAAVHVCEEIAGYQYCDEATLDHYRAITPTESLADPVHWAIERSIEPGFVGTVPVTVTAYDAAGNNRQLRFDAVIDANTPVAPAETITTTEASSATVELPVGSAVQIGNSEQFYRLQSMWLEAENKCLTANQLAPEAFLGGGAHMADCQDAPNQLWRFVRQPEQEGYHWLQTLELRAGGLCLDGNNVSDEAMLGGAALLGECQAAAGQAWRLTVADTDGYYRLQTLALVAEDQCLESGNADPARFLGGAAHMTACQDVSGQLWKLVPVVDLTAPEEPVTTEVATPEAAPPDPAPTEAESGWQLSATLEGHTGAVSSVTWLGDGSYLASGGVDSVVQVWNLATGERLLTLTGHEGAVSSVAWSPTARYLASSAADGAVHLWELKTGEPLLTLIGHEGAVNSIALSLDGRYLAAGAANGAVWVWDIEAGENVLTLTGHEGSVTSVAWSPDDRYLAAGAADGAVWVWNLETSKPLFILTGHEGAVSSVAWSFDGSSYLASGSVDGTVRVWNMENGKPVVSFDDPKGAVSSVAWSPDKRYLTAGGADGIVRLWTLETGKMTTIAGHDGPINSLLWSPDSSYLATGAEDGKVRIWKLAQVD